MVIINFVGYHKVCRKYYSPQSGYYFGTSIFIIKDSII
jgi:hypothetical protein